MQYILGGYLISIIEGEQHYEKTLRKFKFDCSYHQINNYFKRVPGGPCKLVIL